MARPTPHRHPLPPPHDAWVERLLIRLPWAAGQLTSALLVAYGEAEHLFAGAAP